MRFITSFCVLTLSFTISFSQEVFSFYFDIDSSKPLNYELPEKIGEWKNIKLVASTDYLGDSIYNINLSKRRAFAIEKILKGKVTSTIELDWLGEVGPVKQDKSGDANSRRVDVFYTISEQITQVEQRSLQEEVDELEIGQTLVLKNLNFIPGYALLIDSARQSAIELLQIMQENPKLKISIEGHICCQQDPNLSDGLNHATGYYDLSHARAKYIYDFLKYNGISADRMTFKGFAKKQPLFPLERNENEEQANRRVEIRIVEK